MKWTMRIIIVNQLCILRFSTIRKPLGVTELNIDESLNLIIDTLIILNKDMLTTNLNILSER